MENRLQKEMHVNKTILEEGERDEAVQWFENGDHPQDAVFRPFEDTGKIPVVAREGLVVRYYRHPNVPGDKICSDCGKKMHVHGWIDNSLDGGQTVCPGDWIFIGENNEYNSVHNKEFKESNFKKVVRECETCMIVKKGYHCSLQYQLECKKNNYKGWKPLI
jgi:hypothetical protein